MRKLTAVTLLGLLLVGGGLWWLGRAPGRAGGAPAAASVPGRLAYASHGSIYLWSGGHSTRLTFNDHDAGPTLAPDGAQIVFARVDPIGWSDLYSVATGGGTAQALTNNRPGPASDVGTQAYAANSVWMLQPSFSADGSRLAFLSDVQTPELALWVAGPDATARRRIAKLDGGIEHPAWSPDGSQIAASTFTRGRAEVWSYSLADAQWSEVAAPPDGAYDPAWSPDGRLLAYAARTGTATDIWVVPADRSTDPVRLTTNGKARAPVWSPARDQIAFIAEHDSTFDLYAMSVLSGTTPITAGAPQQITDGAAVDAPSGVSWSR